MFIEPIVEVALSRIAGDNLTPSNRVEACSILQRYLLGSISYEDATQLTNNLKLDTAAVELLKEVLEVDKKPIPSRDAYNLISKKAKTRQWSQVEDTRLLAGILKYGTDQWTAVAQFVGNKRKRSQCAQRWNRGLNPRIKKALWSNEENQKLLDLIEKYGNKSWTKISSEIGDRSDVQCRYQYMQYLKKQRFPLNMDSSSELSQSEDIPQAEESHELIEEPNTLAEQSWSFDIDFDDFNGEYEFKTFLNLM